LILPIAVLSGMAACLPGCGEEEKEKPKPRPTVVAAAEPTLTPIDELMETNGIDSRVWLNDAAAPPNDAERLMVLRFFDAFAKGDADLLRPFLDDVEREELAILEQRGDLRALAGQIEGIEIQTGSASSGQIAVLGLFEFSDRIEGQMWEAVSGIEGGVFRAAPLPPGLSTQLGSEPFLDWYAAVEREAALLSQADLGVEQAAAVASVGEEEFDEGGSSGGGGSSPSR